MVTGIIVDAPVLIRGAKRFAEIIKAQHGQKVSLDLVQPNVTNFC